MNSYDPETAQATALQLIRQALRSRNLTRLREAFQRPWVIQVLKSTPDDAFPSGPFKIFSLALEGLTRDERKRVFQWTWDCYHPLMSDLGKALQDIDGTKRARPH